MSENQFTLWEATLDKVWIGMKRNPRKTLTVGIFVVVCIFATGYFYTKGANLASDNLHQPTTSISTTTPCSITLTNNEFDNSGTAISVPSNMPANSLCGTGNSFNNNQKDFEIRNP